MNVDFHESPKVNSLPPKLVQINWIKSYVDLFKVITMYIS